MNKDARKQVAVLARGAKSRPEDAPIGISAACDSARKANAGVIES